MHSSMPVRTKICKQVAKITPDEQKSLGLTKIIGKSRPTCNDIGWAVQKSSSTWYYKKDLMIKKQKAYRFSEYAVKGKILISSQFHRKSLRTMPRPTE